MTQTSKLEEIESLRDPRQRFERRVELYAELGCNKPIISLCKEHEVVVAREICNVATSNIRIMSMTFGLHNPDSIYKTTEFVEALVGAIRRNVSLQVLITETDQIPFLDDQDYLRGSDPIQRLLLETSKGNRGSVAVSRLTDIPEALQGKPLHFMTADESAYRLHFHPRMDKVIGKTCFNDPDTTRELNSRFEQGYEHSTPLFEES